MAVEKNLIEIQSELQSPAIRDEDLVKYANGSNSSVPSFLALMEMSRRKQLEEGSKSFDASNQKSIKDQLTNALTAPNQMRGAITGAPLGQVNPTAAPTGIAMGAAPANQVNPTQAPPMPQPAGAMTAAAGGLMSLPIDHFKPSSYAGGGIVAFGDPELNPNENQLVNASNKTVAGVTLDKAISIARDRNAQSNIPFTSEDESVLRRRFAGADADPVKTETPDAGITSRVTTPQAQGRGPASFQSILESLPKVQGNTMPAPQELTREQAYENIKENRRLAGVSEDPYAEVNKRQSAIEERQKAGYEQQGLDRLLTQLTAFSKADPAKGFGYASAVSADASMALEQQQNALRDKQEQVQLDYAKNMAKEEDARRRGDATGIQAALEGQKKDQAEYAKLLQKDQEIETQRINSAANIYQTTEYAAARKQAAADAADNKPTAEDKKLLKVQTTVNAHPAVRAIADAIKQGMIEQGSPEYYDALRRINEIARPLYVQADLTPPDDIIGAVPNTPPVKKPGLFESIFGGSSKPAKTGKTVSFDDLPK